jgi:hypothetical protein
MQALLGRRHAALRFGGKPLELCEFLSSRHPVAGSTSAWSFIATSDECGRKALRPRASRQLLPECRRNAGRETAHGHYDDALSECTESWRA